MPEKRCFLCGRNGSVDKLDRHHIFGGPYRNLSEKYKAVVYLCHNDCHIFGKEAVHRNAGNMLKVKQYGQKKLMQEQNWTTEDFIRKFGKNYL